MLDTSVIIHQSIQNHINSIKYTLNVWFSKFMIIPILDLNKTRLGCFAERKLQILWRLPSNMMISSSNEKEILLIRIVNICVLMYFCLMFVMLRQSSFILNAVFNF